MADTRATRTAISERSWTITGASAETREKVKAAADAEGMAIRAWVDKTLNAAADGRLVSSEGPSSIAVDPKTLADISAKLDGLTKRLPECQGCREGRGARYERRGAEGDGGGVPGNATLRQGTGPHCRGQRHQEKTQKSADCYQHSDSVERQSKIV